MNMCVGKMAQSPIQTTVEFVSDDERLTQIFCDKSLEIDSCFPISNGWDQVAYHKKDSFLRSNRKANMCVNATVTSLSRIYIDKALRKLQEDGAELIYSDTDSVIFSIDKARSSENLEMKAFEKFENAVFFKIFKIPSDRQLILV